MPSITSSLIRAQIRMIKPILTRSGIPAARTLQEKLGELGAKVVSGKVDFHEFQLGDIECAWALPEDMEPGDRRVALYLHGGGYVAGSIKYAKGFAGILAAKLRVRVMCVAYRLAPEFPFPAAVDDAMASYEHLLSLGLQPGDISLIGESAGGGLIFALCLALKQRGMAMPARLIALSPWTDLTMSGDTYETKRQADVSLSEDELREYMEAYAPDRADDPLASPLLGDLTGLPPTVIYTGGDEILLDDSLRMALHLEEAGVSCRLSVAEGMWHAYVLYGVPEANDALTEIQAFFEESIHA
jgi:monoterpene epsilon-lactone hydrolase